MGMNCIQSLVQGPCHLTIVRVPHIKCITCHTPFQSYSPRYCFRVLVGLSYSIWYIIPQTIWGYCVQRFCNFQKPAVQCYFEQQLASWVEVWKYAGFGTCLSRPLFTTNPITLHVQLSATPWMPLKRDFPNLFSHFLLLIHYWVTVAAG